MCVEREIERERKVREKRERVRGRKGSSKGEIKKNL
jgi:hypothetical protein